MTIIELIQEIAVMYCVLFCFKSISEKAHSLGKEYYDDEQHFIACVCYIVSILCFMASISAVTFYLLEGWDSLMALIKSKACGG